MYSGSKGVTQAFFHASLSTDKSQAEQALSDPDQLTELPEQREGDTGELCFGIFSKEICDGVFPNLALGSL